MRLMLAELDVTPQITLAMILCVILSGAFLGIGGAIGTWLWKRLTGYDKKKEALGLITLTPEGLQAMVDKAVLTHTAALASRISSLERFRNAARNLVEKAATDLRDVAQMLPDRNSKLERAITSLEFFRDLEDTHLGM